MTGRVTIDVLPDEVLLEIVDCYVYNALLVGKIDAWHTLVHVSRKWRWLLTLPLVRLTRFPWEVLDFILSIFHLLVSFRLQYPTTAPALLQILSYHP